MPPRKEDRSIDSLMDTINKSMDAMYQKTYYSTSQSNKTLDDLTKSINQNIDRITNFNMNTVGMPSVTKLYSRMQMQGRAAGGEVSNLFDSALNFDDFYSNFMQNRYLTEQDEEIDAVCKYFPELLEALDVKKESVLAADHFSKDYLSISSTSIPDAERATFSEHCKYLKERYNLLQLIDEIYDNVAKYGEQFLYVVPYSAALSRLLTDKPNTTFYGNKYSTAQESAISDDTSLTESFVFSVTGKDKSLHIRDIQGIKKESIVEAACTKPVVDKEGKFTGKYDTPGILADSENFHLNVEINRSGIIESLVQDAYNTSKKKNSLIESVSSQFLRENNIVLEKEGLKIVKKNKNTGDLEIDQLHHSTGSDKLEAPDGLITNTKFGMNTTSREEIKVEVPGCVVSKVRREQVIPIYIGNNDTCLGYYYIEMRTIEQLQDFQGYQYIMGDTLTGLRGSNSGINAPFNVVDPGRQEELLQYIAGELSRFIDKEFVQSNQDLRDEIYMILKQNDLFNTPSIDKLKISFVPPEDMIHFYFKLDPITHRGISDLERAMVPAKIYACMYITDAIAQLVRGQDKRVFYVKQNVDTNISQTLLNTIQQIKQGNFGLRQFSSINNVLNITGKFNDFLVPVGPSGDSPIQIEVLPGQQFSDNTERMQQLKQMAIESIDVPFEMIQMRNSVDYAMQLSMSSSKFLRKVFHRQSLFTPFLKRFITKLYNYEFKENIEIDVTLPPPMFLNMANTNQLVDNIKTFVTSVTEYETNSIDDEKQKNKYYDLLLKYYLGSHVDISIHEKMLKEALLKQPKEDDNGGY